MNSIQAVATHPLALVNTFLFVPATRPERFAKALLSGAGGVIIDLEDAVAAADKLAARSALMAGVAALPAEQRARVLVRINAVGTAWHADDVAAAAGLVALGVAGVMLPKAERAEDLAVLAKALTGSPEGQCVLVPLVESLAGLDALDDLARAPHVVRLALGHIDLQVDLGMACGDDESELASVRLALVMASRRAGLASPIDGVTTATGDAARLQRDAARSRRFGFGAKLCIHPAQVAGVHAAFAPTTQELAWSHRVLEAAHEHGSGAFSLDGRMVDAPVLRIAERNLARAAQAAGVLGLKSQ